MRRTYANENGARLKLGPSRAADTLESELTVRREGAPMGRLTSIDSALGRLGVGALELTHEAAPTDRDQQTHYVA